MTWRTQHALYLLAQVVLLRKCGHAEAALKISRVLFGCYVIVCLFVLYRVMVAVPSV